MVCIFKVRRESSSKDNVVTVGFMLLLKHSFSGTMRPWLLLVSLLVSDRSPPGDGDWVMDYYTRSLCRKLLQMTPLGLEILQTEHQSMQRNCLCVAVQHKRTSPFYWAHTDHHDHGCSLFQQEFTGIIHRNHIPALVCLFQSVLVWISNKMQYLCFIEMAFPLCYVPCSCTELLSQLYSISSMSTLIYFILLHLLCSAAPWCVHELSA